MMREDWVETELGKVCDFVGGGTPSKKEPSYWNGDIPWASIKDIKGGYLTDTKDYITEKGLRNSAANVAQPEEIILATRINPGKPIRNKIRAAINQDLKIVKPRIDIDNDFLYYTFLNLERKILKVSSGTTVLGVNLNNLRDITFPLAPLPEQRAIVAKIEKISSDLDNGIANLKTAKAKLDIYRQAVLKKAFEGELTREWRKSYKGQTASDLFKKIKIKREELFTQGYNDWIIKYEGKNASEKKKPQKPKKPVFGVRLTDNEIQNMPNIPNSWHILRFIDLIKYEDNGIKRGPFGSAIKKGFFVPSGFKVYEQQNAIRGDSRLGTYYIDEKKYKELEKFSVKGGDFIVSCSGTIGRIHKLDYDCEPGVINQALLKIVLDEQLMYSKYFFYLFRSEGFQRKILKGTRGTGMQNLASVDEIKQIPIQLPSIDEQLQIVQEIESRLSICDKLAESIDQSLEKSEALRQSILKRAFAGQLLSEAELSSCRREPDWEPAAKLLERIKKDKSVDAKNATTGKTLKANNI